MPPHGKFFNGAARWYAYGSTREEMIKDLKTEMLAKS